jgi:hypothetical protein
VGARRDNCPAGRDRGGHPGLGRGPAPIGRAQPRIIEPEPVPLFAALGIAATVSAGGGTFQIPENGYTSINLPLHPTAAGPRQPGPHIPKPSGVSTFSSTAWPSASVSPTPSRQAPKVKPCSRSLPQHLRTAGWRPPAERCRAANSTAGGSAAGIRTSTVASVSRASSAAMNDRIIAGLPMDRVRPETDFVRPGLHGHQPGDTAAVVKRLAELWGVSTGAAQHQCWTNLRRLAVRSGALDRLPGATAQLLLQL